MTMTELIELKHILHDYGMELYKARRFEDSDKFQAALNAIIKFASQAIYDSVK